MNTLNNESKKLTTIFSIADTAANDSLYFGKTQSQPKHNGKDVVYVGEQAEVMQAHYYRRLWIGVNSIEISRREWPDKMSLDIANFDGIILNSDGSLFDMPYIDDVFGEDVHDMRWMSDFLKSDLSGTRPNTTSRKWQKVQLIDLSLRIAHPDIARHFGK